MTIQEALLNVLIKFGLPNLQGRITARIPMHRDDYISQFDSETLEVLMHLPYAFDNTGAIKYDIKKVDQIVNLTVWQD